MNNTLFKKIYALLLGITACLSLSGCGNAWLAYSDKTPIPGERISLIQQEEGLTASTTSHSFHSLPPTQTNEMWAQTGGNSQHQAPNVALGDPLKKVWKHSAGHGATKYSPILTGPVANAQQIFALDTRGQVTALALETGKKLWQCNILPEKYYGDPIGGGICYENGFVYAASPFAEVLCISSDTGTIAWRASLRSPARISPTVHEGRVYVLNITNELEVFNAQDGSRSWDHSGITETAGILGGAAPAADQGVVIAAYSSGEIFALKAENGHELWSESLASHYQLDAISALAHIHAAPVIADGVVYAISHGGKLAAINLRSGGKIWEKSVAGLHAPTVIGQYLFLVTLHQQVACLDKLTGQTLWVKELNKQEGEEKDSDPTKTVRWCGPLIANNQLIVASSKGEIRFLSPQNGSLLHTLTLSDGIPVSPIVVKDTLIVFTKDADLIAFR